jgi:protein-disulfide isomerase
MAWIDKAATASGWVFLLAAAVVVGRPAGPVGRAIREWLEARQTRQLVVHHWGELVERGGVLGTQASSAAVVEFIDYQCAYCRLLQDTISAVLETHEDAAIAIRQLPRLGDATSRSAALAAVCAEAQGRFSEMHHHLLKSGAWVRTPDWLEVAESVGVQDLQGFASCIESAAASNVITLDSSWARRLSIEGTPALVGSHGEVRTGMMDRETLEQWLQLVRPTLGEANTSRTTGR